MDDYPFLSEAISNVITRLRENAGLSKRKLSMLSSIDRVYILQVEQGKYRPTVNFMFLLAQSLGISPAAMFAMVESEVSRLRAEAEQAQSSDSLSG